jgi:transposase
MPKSRRPYPLEYRQRIIELVRAGRSPESLAQEFEPTAPCIRNWVRQADRDDGRRGDGLSGRTDRIAAPEARECHAP